MLSADKAPYFKTCPHCGMGSLETFSTHSYCVNCNHSESEDDSFLYMSEILEIEKMLNEHEKKRAAKKSRCNFVKEISEEEVAS